MKKYRSILIGSFDGLHIGHQFLIEEFIRDSILKDVNPSVLTYKVHPLKILNPELENYYIDSDEARTKNLSNLVSTIFCEFEDYKNMTAQLFFKSLLLKYPDLKFIYMGHDSSFGCDKINDISTLNSFESGLEFVQLHKYSKKDVSSTLIRNKIREGELREFKELTKRDFTITSSVIPGKQLGRTIGFPTANLYVDPKRVRLPNGVYHGEVIVDDKSFHFVANIGLRPTVDEDMTISIEAHILDFDDDIYGHELSLVILGKVRDIKKFNSKDDLMNQINEDVKFVRSQYA